MEKLLLKSKLNDLDVPLLHVSETLVKAKPPGGTPVYKPYRYVPPHRVGFLRRFGLESGRVFEGTRGVYKHCYRFDSK